MPWPSSYVCDFLKFIIFFFLQNCYVSGHFHFLYLIKHKLKYILNFFFSPWLAQLSIFCSSLLYLLKIVMEGYVMCSCTFRMKASFSWTFFCSVIPFQAVEAKILLFGELHFLLSGHSFVAFAFIKDLIFFTHNACGFTECGLAKSSLVTASISPFL